MKITTLGIPSAVPPKSREDRAGYEKHASLESIQMALADAERAVRKAEDRTRWLRGLLVERLIQIVRGQWPARKEGV